MSGPNIIIQYKVVSGRKSQQPYCTCLLGVTEHRFIDVMLFSNVTSAVKLFVFTGFRVKSHLSDVKLVLN